MTRKRAGMVLGGVGACRSTVLRAFEFGAHGFPAVKIVDDRGIESLWIIDAP